MNYVASDTIRLDTTRRVAGRLAVDTLKRMNFAIEFVRPVSIDRGTDGRVFDRKNVRFDYLPASGLVTLIEKPHRCFRSSASAVLVPTGILLAALIDLISAVQPSRVFDPTWKLPVIPEIKFKLPRTETRVCL